ncbi:hypothetical protein MIS24_22810 [Vibrio parahaemolyticus]|nr:hypothetical protein [Vibrio parahaemolyticus]
MAFLLCVDFSD